jgi:dTDP-4-amino-4,6-dideoxygalactose transaminase
LKYLKEVLDSGWLTTAKKAFNFEKQFADFVGARFAFTVNSCTSALHLAVEALGVKAGDKVFVPSLTFTASAEILRYIGADPVFLDVDYGTGLISSAILLSAIKTHPEVKVLVLVHYGGQAPVMTSANGDGIIDICRGNNIKVVEDAAHAFPTKCGDNYIGSFGDVTCFSFYANKTITTGEGGMIVTNDETIAKRVKLMRLHGINHDVWDRFTSSKPCWEYDVVAPGFKYNMPDINAAIGLAQLENAAYFRDQRQRCAQFYLRELKDVTTLDLPVCDCPIENHSWHLFPVIVRPEARVSRNDFITALQSCGIGTSVHYKPLHRMTYYCQCYSLNPDDYPNTERIWNGTVSLPIYPDLTDDNLQYICDCIREILA